MIEYIDYNAIRYAIVINSSHSSNGIEFFTAESYSQQLGYMKRPANYFIRPHRHKINARMVHKTQEVLYLKEGRVKISFYSDKGDMLGYKLIKTGDVIMLCDGGHSIEFLEESQIIEIKQGPYSENEDKEFLD